MRYITAIKTVLFIAIMPISLEVVASPCEAATDGTKTANCVFTQLEAASTQDIIREGAREDCVDSDGSSTALSTRGPGGSIDPIGNEPVDEKEGEPK